MRNYCGWFMIFAALILAGCSGNEKAKELRFSGTLELNEHSVGARAAGRIVSLAADE